MIRKPPSILPAFRIFLNLGALLFAVGIANAQPTLSGTVRNATSGIGVAGADLDVYDATGARVAVTGDTTIVGGTYTITLPAPGDYIVRVDMSVTDPLADQYYPGTFLKSQAAPIAVPSNSSAITGIDFDLVAGTSISGQVTGGGTALANVDLDLYASNGEFLGGYPARTDAGGFFYIGGLPPGNYYLRADPDPVLGQFYVLRYYFGGTDIASATPIVVGSSPVPGVNWDLPAGGIVRGTIRTNGTHLPLEAIDLDVYTAAGVRVATTGKSAIDGTYSVGPLPTGAYLVRADPDPAQGWVRQYYGGSFAQTTGVAVNVTNGWVTANIDFALDAGGVISGTIRRASTASALSGIDLDIFNPDGSRVDLTAKSDVTGSYQLGPLPFGDYIVRADPAAQSGYAGVYFGGSEAPSSALPISAGPGATVADFNLPDGGWITGTVRSSVNAPLAGIDLDVYLPTGERLYPSARTAADGSYLIGPLPVGSVVLRADPGPVEGHQVIYHPAGMDFASATPITIAAALAAAGQDFVLPDAGWIAGTIKDSGGIPLAGIDLDVFLAATGARVLQGATTATDGTFVIGPLEPNSYVVRADPSFTQPYVRRYHPDASTMATAAAVSVVAGAGATGLDLALPAGRSLAGQILDPAGFPITGIDLDVLDPATGMRLEQTAVTGVDGRYQIPPVPLGAWNLLADPPAAATAYVNTYYGNTWDVGASPLVTVDASGALDALDIRLLGYEPPVISYSGGGTSGYIAAVGSNPTLSFDGDMTNGVVTEMRFESGGAVIGTDTAAPFTLSFTGLTPGAHRFVPIAMDIFGGQTIGPEQTVVVLSSMPSALHPAIVPLYDASQRVILAWPGENGVTYAVESSANLGATEWIEEARFTGNGSLLAYSEAEWGTALRFLRVQTLP